MKFAEGINRRKVLLTFDVEEFDIPLEYGRNLPTTEQLAVGREGFERVLALLENHKIRATLYCTAFFATENSDLVQKAHRLGMEIASHGYFHSRFENAHLRDSRDCLSAMIGEKVRGFRSARFAPVSREEIANAGYLYNSSENPIWVPGRYNGWKRPRLPYIEAGIPQLPMSASPLVRFPLFWLAFKNFPFRVYWFFASWTLRRDGFLHLLFHPWEFCELAGYDLPKMVRRLDSEALLQRLEALIVLAKKRADFVITADFLRDRFNLPADW